MFLMILVFTDGWDNIGFSHKQRVLFNSAPCLTSGNNNAYNIFEHQHILSYDFDRNSKQAWADYLNDMELCGRKPLQSFLPRYYTDSIKRICNGQGTEVERNLCISTDMFLVYIVRSALVNNRCEVHVRHRSFYVTVACDVIDNECLPVHYQTQTSNEPEQRGSICKLHHWPHLLF